MTMLSKIVTNDYETPFGLHKFGSIDSIDSVLDQDVRVRSPSVDLDNLSNCLSEASKITTDVDEKKGVLSELYNAQISFWMLVFSFLYSYAWLQHRKKFMMTSFVIIPTVLGVCFTVAWLLGAIVILSRIFSAHLNIDGMFKSFDEEPGSPRRRLNSTASATVTQYDRSLSYEELPRPLCRMHSVSNTSINNIGINAASANANGRQSPSVQSRKFSYTFTHQSAED